MPIKAIITCIALSFSSFLHADLDKELNSFFNKFGSVSNVTSGDVYIGQTAGYATGGGVSIRNRVYSDDLASVSLPRIDSGCGGIDIYTGGFSFISKDQLVAAMKSVGSNAVSYAFLLGLETVSPQVANAIKQLQSWANTINGIGINSCEFSMGLVGSAWPKSETASQQVCRTMGSSNGFFDSFIDSRHQCTSASQQAEVHREVKKKYKDMLIGPSNLTWEAIKQQKFLASNKELAYLFMTLVGTVISKEDKNGHKLQFYPPKANKEDFLKAIMQGGDAEIYRCASSDGQCLTISKDKVTISEKNSWYGRIKGILIDMQQKAIDDQPLTDAQKDLLNKTRFPLYRIVNVLTAYKHGHAMVDLCKLADIVSKEILIEYLKEVQESVKAGMFNVRNLQIYQNPEELDEFEKRLKEVEDKILHFESKLNELVDREFQMMQKIEFIEEKIASELRLDDV